MSDDRGKRLVIIDGKSVFYRGYYAMPNLSTKDGTPTGGVFGFATMALEVVKKLKPNYVCVAWDKAKTNIRSRLELYPQYKANRKPAPPDFYEQIPILQELLEALGWPLYEIDDYEADDIMGAFAKQAGEEGIESYLVTSDLDVLQLINRHTHIYTLKKGLSHIELFNEASFVEKYGVDAHQWVDVKALKGDSSDNIPGVAGIGEKTAIELIKTYETLDGVYQHLDDLKPAVRIKLEKDKDMAYLSKKLVTLMVDAPIKIDLGQAKLQDGVTPEFVAILRKLEFKNLLRQVEATLPEQEKSEAVASESALQPARQVAYNAADFANQTPRVLATNPEMTELWVSSEPKSYAVVQLDVAPAGQNVPEVVQGSEVSVVAEKPVQQDLFGELSLPDNDDSQNHEAAGGTEGGDTAARSLRGRWEGDLSDTLSARDESVRPSAKLRKLTLPQAMLGTRGVATEGPITNTQAVTEQSAGLEINSELVQTLAGAPVIGHDLKAIFRGLMAYGYDWPGKIGHDTRVGAFLLDSLTRQHELGDLLEQPVDTTNPGQTIAAIWQAYKDQQKQFERLPTITKLAREVEFPTIKLLAVIEHRGILLDSDYLQDMSQKFAIRIGEFEQKIYEFAGQEFNISSPSQLATILFDKMGLPTQGIKKGKTGYSTGANELDKLRGLNPIIDLITAYREYTKLKSTYIDTLPKQVDSEGKLHTTFNLDVAATGRLSSNNPNLQNIPTRTDIGQAIRSAFIPHGGNVFVSADYSQFELRLAAVMANDKKMIEDFNQDIDIHVATAAEVYGVPIEKVDKTMRRNAKVVNFGILYGMSPHGLSIATGMGRDEAKAFIDTYFALRQPIRDYMDKTIQEGLKNGYVQTIFGRRRPTPDLKSSNFIVREAAKRAAINMPIQGTEADLMKMAMLAVEEKLGNLGEQLLQVHDSILVETPKENSQKVADILKETMEEVYSLPVALKVDVSIGNNWGEL